MNRILVIGSGGAGKSTVARELGVRLSLPVIHLDREFWSAGWVPTPPDVWRAHIAELTTRESWVMDGNYGGTMPARLEACDTVVFLDMPRLTCLRRVLRRALTYRGRSRPDMAAGCPERLTWAFIWWLLIYPARRRPGIMRQLAALPSSTRVVILSDSAEVESFLQTLVLRYGRLTS